MAGVQVSPWARSAPSKSPQCPPPIVILVSQGMRVLYFVETLCLRAGTMAQINYDEDWESGVEVVTY